MIGVEWRMTGFRAYRFARDGAIRDRRQGARGVVQVQDRRFADTLREEIGPWLAAGEEQVVLSGMIGSREGWLQTAYLPCPAGVAELAEALVDVPFGWGKVKLVPGLAATDPGGVPEVMRGEETRLIGALATVGERGVVCLPGMQSKWARIEDGRIAGFSTWMTGEALTSLRNVPALGRMLRDPPVDLHAFDQGVARSADPGGVLHHLFGVRALALAGRLSEGAAPAYLQGLLVGHEVREAAPRGGLIHLIGAPEATALYERAIAACRGRPVVIPPDEVTRGLFLIGSAAVWG